MSEPDPLLLFLHIPKTAGTTLENYFYAAYLPEDPGETDEGGFLNYGIYHYALGWDVPVLDDLRRVAARPDVHIVLGHFMFGLHESLGRPFTYATVLREPVDRAISVGAHHMRWSGPVDDRSFTTEALAEFLLASKLKELDNGQTRRISGVDPAFGACSDTMLETAKHNLVEHFSLVGITERFDETLSLFKRTLDWSIPGVYYPPMQVSPDREEQPALSTAVREGLAEQNRLDSKLYTFACRLFDVRLQELGDVVAADVAEIEELRAAYIHE